MSTDRSILAEVRPEVTAAEPSAPAAPSVSGLAPGLVVTESVEVEQLSLLFSCLDREDVAHSWKNIGVRERRNVEGIVEWENVRRPTELFFFSLEDGDERRLVAAAAVAERLTHDFPNPGFCVLSRCYVMPGFRGQGFYRATLQFRLEYCRARFGSGLRAIHLGTMNPRIAQAVTKGSIPGWPAFSHLGREHLSVGATVKTVEDYLLLVPSYVGRLEAAVAGVEPPSCIAELRVLVSALGSRTVDNVGPRVKAAVEDARSQGWFLRQDPEAFDELLLFCQAIPLIGFC